MARRTSPIMKKLMSLLLLSLITINVSAELIMTANIKAIWDKDHWYTIKDEHTYLQKVEVHTDELIIYNFINNGKHHFKLVNPIYSYKDFSFKHNEIEDVFDSTLSIYGMYKNKAILSITDAEIEYLVHLRLTNVNYFR